MQLPLLTDQRAVEVARDHYLDHPDQAKVPGSRGVLLRVITLLARLARLHGFRAAKLAKRRLYLVYSKQGHIGCPTGEQLVVAKNAPHARLVYRQWWATCRPHDDSPRGLTVIELDLDDPRVLDDRRISTIVANYEYGDLAA